MARDHARLKLAIWRDTEFTARSVDAKFLYFSLLCAPKLTWCGSLDYSPKQLATLDESYNATKVRRVIKELVAHRYVLVDDRTDEIAIRSFIRHDGVLNSPNVAKAMGKAIASLLSPQIRDGLLTELRRLHDEVPEAKGWASFAEGFPELYAQVVSRGSSNPSAKGSSKGSANPSPPRVRTSRALSPSPSPLPLPLPTTSGDVVAAGTSVEVAPVGPPDGADKLLAEWIRSARSRPPERVIGQVGKELRAMLSEGLDPFGIRAGFMNWQAKGQHPSTLPSFVNAAMNARPAKTTHQQATDGLFDRAAARMGAAQ